jgi:uncharacterized membrane protein
MSWFFIALAAPFLWSICNHIDKYLLTKYFRSGGVGALIIYSSFIAILVIPVIFFIRPDVTAIAGRDILLLLGAGMLSAIAILFYLFAMDEGETSMVVPFFQLIPVFSFIFGYLFLGETLTQQQIFAGLLILLGSIILSIEIEEDQKYRFRIKLAIFMLISSIIFALYEAMFKFVAVGEDFWISSFWHYVGLLLIGVILFLGVKAYRREFIDMVRLNGPAVFSLNLTSEILTVIGNLMLAFATLLAPLALVGLVAGYQPLFVFLGGIILTTFFPKIATEKIKGIHLAQKILAIIIVFIGSYLLSF